MLVEYVFKMYHWTMPNINHNAQAYCSVTHLKAFNSVTKVKLIGNVCTYKGDERCSGASDRSWVKDIMIQKCILLV